MQILTAGCFLLLADGTKGMVKGTCHNRAESAAMNDLSRSLVLVNYFRDLPNLPAACKDNSAQLLDMVTTCHDKSGNRWPNFIAVDFYKVNSQLRRSSHLRGSYSDQL